MRIQKKKSAQKKMNDSHEYGCEYAKSNLSTCKQCFNKIDKGKLRLAIYVQSPKFDGKMANWYHVDCFFEKFLLHDPIQIRGFGNLRYFFKYHTIQNLIIKFKLTYLKKNKDGKTSKK